ncbi:hypothetical protein G3I40_14570 [Streptomyces sp. SID14478]|uniref:hypothetical protein n=1 Tax=Streptomyces sp. SID14478 TaxID=2706073 RepID=UPI0013DBEDEC|nr:hypothetical protein [Streptomyces sp. SID14478]NEB76438.1 hypothetical protein [Streptomyces sp. SID14478]
MIRIVTRKRLARLEADTHAAFERARETSEAAHEAAARHVVELATVTGRAKRAEESKNEVGEMFTGAVAELAAAQQELLLKGNELRRLREELAEACKAARQVFVLLHYGTPVMVYGSREDAYADTATHHAPADKWGPTRRFWADAEWLLAAFIYDAASQGFRGSLEPVAEPVGGAA